MIHSMRRSLLTVSMLAIFSPFAQASEVWPSKPVRMIVSYPAGGVSDSVARAMADKLSAQLEAPVIVENKAGAGGSLGLDAVAKSQPDGYTIGFAAISPIALNPHLGRSPFDPQKDLTPVISVMYSPVLIMGTSANRDMSFEALLRSAKAEPGAIRWATSGLASLGHMVMEQVKHSAKVDITHIPYKGGGQQLNDALGGQFEVLSTNAGPAVMQHLKSGKFKALAVGAPKRLDTLPQVPTLAELGYSSANLNSLFGIFAPAHVPAEVLQRLNTEFNKVLAMPDIQDKLIHTDNVPTGGTAHDFARQIAKESAENARIIKAAGIKLN